MRWHLTAVRRTLRRFCCGWVLAALAGPATAEQFALLVGVSAYPNLPAHLQLQGPANDVRRMRDVLVQRGFDAQRIRVLADGVDGAALPTRAAILDALDTLARQARAGDLVVVQFAGHGSQQPIEPSAADAQAEPDGWHETFLPRDVGRWDGRRGAVANAITDTTLRGAIDRIGDGGAFVWAIFDACHSATLVRGGDERAGLRVRQVLPADLGLTARQPPLRRSTPGPAAASPGLAGNSTPPRRRAPAAYFYAAQSTEPAVELLLPAGAKDAQTLGLLTYTVAQALASGQAMSYRQLGQHILFQYGGMLQAHATPLYSGDGLDEPVLGQRAPQYRQWPLDTRGGLIVPAGSLDGLAVGARFVALASPLAPDPARSGSGRVTELEAVTVSPSQSTLTLLPSPGLAATAAPAAGTWVRLVSNPPTFAMRVAVDLTACPPGCKWRGALAQLRRDGVPAVAVEWVAPGDNPELLLLARPAALVYRLPGDALAESAKPVRETGVALPGAGDAGQSVDALARRIADDVHALSRERNLLRVAAQLPVKNAVTDVAATLWLRPAGRPGSEEPLSAEQVPQLRSGDGLSLRVRNRGPGAVDATLLLLDADHGITVLYPRPNGESNRLEAGAVLEVADLSVNATTTGVERLMLVWAPMRTHRERRDFSFLQQAPLSRTRGVGGADADLQALLDACFADQLTRSGGIPAPPADGLGMQVFSFKVMP